jgi:hypothetical protein
MARLLHESRQADWCDSKVSDLEKTLAEFISQILIKKVQNIKKS